MKDSINIGVVGTGKLGTYHIQKLLRQNYVNFIGVFDSNKDLMKSHKKQYNVETFDDIGKLSRSSRWLVFRVRDTG